MRRAAHTVIGLMFLGTAAIPARTSPAKYTTVTELAVAKDVVFSSRPLVAAPASQRRSAT